MLEAKRMGKTLAEGWWLNQAQDHLITENSKFSSISFDTNLYKFIMGGRFRHTGERRMKVPKMVTGDHEHNLLVVQRMAMSGKYTVTELAAAAKIIADEMVVEQQTLIKREIEELKQIAANRQETDGRLEETEDGA